MVKGRFLRFAWIGAFTLLGLVTVYGQAPRSSLKDKQISLKLVNRPLFDAFIRLIYDYDIAIGFEQSLLDDKHDDYFFQTNVPFGESETLTVNGRKTNIGGMRPAISNHLITLEFENARLEDVLNEIVRQMKNYDWVIEDDIVNIFPIRGRDSNLENLLKINVQQFLVPKGVEVGNIEGFIIYTVPEFKTFFAKYGLTYHSFKPLPWFDDRPLPEKLGFTNLSFKELLNSITRSKRGGWILRSFTRETNGENKTFVTLRL